MEFKISRMTINLFEGNPYLKKVEKKGRTKEELHQVIQWLTGLRQQKTVETHKRKSNF
jgi:hypothetical protein